jgi:hypothetical protein
MKAIKITNEMLIFEVELEEPLYKSIQKELNGIYTCVNLDAPFENYVMLCDDEGLLKNLDPNLLGSYLYGYFHHGNPIVGDILLMKDGEEDLEDMTDKEAILLQKSIIKTLKNILEEYKDEISIG